MPVVEPDSERVVAEALVEPAIPAAEDLLHRTYFYGGEVVLEKRATVESCGPRRGLVRVEQEDGLQARAVPRRQPLGDAAVEKGPRRERIGEYEPNRRIAHVSTATASARSIRTASDTPSSSCARSASGGVPQTGHPSTPKAVTRVRPSSSLRSASASPPTGA